MQKDPDKLVMKGQDAFQLEYLVVSDMSKYFDDGKDYVHLQIAL